MKINEAKEEAKRESCLKDEDPFNFGQPLIYSIDVLLFCFPLRGGAVRNVVFVSLHRYF